MAPFLYEEVFMDINAIEDNIIELENSDTTVDNVRELAGLYIVRENLLNRGIRENISDITHELNDILPAYEEYCNVKRKYQLKQVPEEAVIQQMNILCREIQEFVYTLYINTDFYKERRIILNILDEINKKCSK